MSETIARNARPVPILTYHQIAPKPLKGTPFRSLCVAPQDFARQMSLLALLGYQGLSMGALLPYLRGEKVGKVVGITFDDGYLNNLQHALPVLERHTFSATCYVVSGLLGETNVWDAEKGIPQVPLMDVEQLRQWVAGGQEVGAHTRGHACLPLLDPASCEDEVRGCKADLEQLLSVPIDHFCYPYGDYTPAHTKQVADAGYLSATTTQRGRVQAGDDLLQLHRVTVARRTTALGLWIKVATAYEDRRAR